jgi:hypothetical protein
VRRARSIELTTEQNLSWFGKLGAAGPQDDSLPILDWTIKPYRDLIQKSQITIFDFRIYVFARQCELLGRLGRVTEAATKAQWFVASLGRRLRENEVRDWLVPRVSTDQAGGTCREFRRIMDVPCLP